MTRFYLKQREDPHGPSISLFVGNLPTGWAQRQYEKLLLDFITPGMQLLYTSNVTCNLELKHQKKGECVAFFLTVNFVFVS